MLFELPHEFSRLPRVLDYFDKRRVKYRKVNGLQKFKAVSQDFFNNLEVSIDLPCPAGMTYSHTRGGAL